jgi:FXSXX-COOH protein
VSPMPDASLLDLAGKRLADVEAEADASTLDAVLRRLFDPDERDRLTVSAFQSAL